MPELKNDNIPSCGVVFQALGNYGSGIFDPGTGAYLEINVCDQCVERNKDKILLGKRKSEVTLIPWDGIYG